MTQVPRTAASGADVDDVQRSRQDWAAEALRLDQLRDALAEAAQLPADVSDEVLLAEIASRFKGVVRAVVGHGSVRGLPYCECGEPTPTRGVWVAHTETLRAQGVPTATVTAPPQSGQYTDPAAGEEAVTW